MQPERLGELLHGCFQSRCRAVIGPMLEQLVGQRKPVSLIEGLEPDRILVLAECFDVAARLFIDISQQVAQFGRVAVGQGFLYHGGCSLILLRAKQSQTEVVVDRVIVRCLPARLGEVGGGVGKIGGLYRIVTNNIQKPLDSSRHYNVK